MYNNNELYHYGVLGMKWGIRHDHKRAAKIYQKKLNKTEKKTVKNISKYMVNDFKSRKNSNKVIKLGNKLEKKPTDKNKQKYAKAQHNVSKYTSKAEHYNKLRSKGEAKTWSIIGEAAEHGYSVESKKYIADGQKGKTILANILATPLGGAIINQKRHSKYKKVYDGQSPSLISANKWSVNYDGVGSVKVR